MVVLTFTVGLAFGQQAAQGQLVTRLEGIVGPDAAEMIQGIVEVAGRQHSGGVLASVVGLGALLLGALGLFGALQDALNTIWGVQKRRSAGVLAGIGAQLFNRLTSFAAVLLVGLLLIVAFVLSATLSAVATWFGDAVPGSTNGWFVANLVVSFAVITALFAVIYKVLPDVEVAWRDVWIGAIVTSLLFVIGKELIGLCIVRASVGSVYGAAGSLVVLLVWVYYSAQVLLLGAEFTQVYANNYGSRFRPARSAMLVAQEAEVADETAAGGREEPSECGTARRQCVGLADRLFGAYAPLLVGLLLG